MQHVFSTTTSAASRSSVGSMPSAASRPAMRSESCSFIWHPKVRTKKRRGSVTARQCTVRPIRPEGGCMPVDLSGKVAIVTGGGSGVGRSVARALAGAGASVVVTGRTASTLEDARTELSELGVRALAVVCDVREADDISRCLDRTIEEFGRLDVLVNNAHTITHGLLLEATDADMEDEWRSGPF